MPGPVLAVAFALGWALLFFYRAEAISDALPHYSAVERRWVMLSPAILAAHVTLGCILVSLAEPAPWRAATALVLFVAGAAFWFRARAQIGPLRVTRLPDQSPGELRRDGPFGLVRHPLFLGYLIAAAAPIVAAAHPILFVSFAVSFVALAIRASQEERRLRAQLGNAYVAYCRDVKRLIPFVW